jgi:hypothetical protein
MHFLKGSHWGPGRDTACGETEEKPYTVAENKKNAKKMV